MAQEDKMVNDLTAALKGVAASVDSPRLKRVNVHIERSNLVKAVTVLKESFDGYHISTITGTDLGEEIELLYHMFLYSGGVLATVRTKVPKNDPKVDTITTVIDGAVLYEREIHEMFGVSVSDHPDPRLLLLPDDWGDRGFPLRKDWVPPQKTGGEK